MAALAERKAEVQRVVQRYFDKEATDEEQVEYHRVITVFWTDAAMEGIAKIDELNRKIKWAARGSSVVGLAGLVLSAALVWATLNLSKIPLGFMRPRPPSAAPAPSGGAPSSRSSSPTPPASP